jgi:hypothetical protein
MGVSLWQKNYPFQLKAILGKKWLASWAIKQVNIILSKILHSAYHMLARSGLVRKSLPLQRMTRVLSFNRPEGKELQLHLRDRVIGRCRPGQDQWQIARPFRLFIDESTLPK